MAVLTKDMSLRPRNKEEADDIRKAFYEKKELSVQVKENILKNSISVDRKAFDVGRTNLRTR